MIKALVLAVWVGLTALVAPAVACDNMGPGKHVGQVVAVDPAAGTITIMDAQTRAPISFSADKQTLEPIRTQRNVIISFRTEGDRLVVEAIQPAA
jgi:hypothetical protein